jgi:transcriptional regulator of arginine metabolism
MKKKRQQKIIELIQQYNIETQEELSKLLQKEGFEATQATVSRDIRELKLSKISIGSGHQKYVVMQSENQMLGDKYVKVCREGYVSMDMAQNILVMKTVPGMAMAVAAAMDAMQFREIVGCVAGDDTIMIAVRSVDETRELIKKLKKLLEE